MPIRREHGDSQPPAPEGDLQVIARLCPVCCHYANLFAAGLELRGIFAYVTAFEVSAEQIYSCEHGTA
jgi:hypothetical protein